MDANAKANAEANIVPCPRCGRRNRVPARASGRPRCAQCHAALPWVADASDDSFALVAEQAPLPVIVDLWTLLLMRHGEVVARQVGAAPPPVLRTWVDRALSKATSISGGRP
jgi:thioredoxin 2